MPRKTRPELTFQQHIEDLLVRVPQRDAEDDKPERPALTLFPRYRRSRTVRKVADDISAQFAAKADIGHKYLVNHSAGSGKTLTICWLADRLHSLFKPGTSEKLVDLVFILTDRKSLAGAAPEPRPASECAGELLPARPRREYTLSRG